MVVLYVWLNTTSPHASVNWVKTLTKLIALTIDTLKLWLKMSTLGYTVLSHI